MVRKTTKTLYSRHNIKDDVTINDFTPVTSAIFLVDSTSALRFEDIDSVFALKNFRPHEEGFKIDVGEKGILWSFTRIKNTTGEYGEFYFSTGFNNFTEASVIPI